MASPLSGNGEDLLQAALSDAFSVGNLPHEPVAPAAASQSSDASTSSSALETIDTSSQPTRPDVDAEPLTPEAFEAAKSEYESHLAKWKAENAEQREAALNKRASWAKIREEEGRKGRVGVNEVKESILGPPVGVSASSEDWERLLAQTRRESPSPADGRDVTKGEREGGKRTEEELASQRILPGSSPAEHKKSPSSAPWEDVPSELASSFPSLSFPEDSNTHSHQPSDSHHDHAHEHHHGHHGRHGDKTASATLTVFDSTLSTRTRVWALVGAVGINLLLPFVNGVMLGFGEIFAKDVVMGWLGWGKGKGTSGVGLRTGRRRS
ncbi:hypothetical protein PENSPDRAFT_754935 [Peniophora sp. CONT]|nr:hypothetical protein PENSPDRAFT_754935 [Peniophora sp. CONT]